MALNKRKKTDHVQLSDNWVAVPSKSHSNRTYYYNKVTKETTWENPMKNVQKDVIRTKDGQSSGSSRKRKSVDDTESSNPSSVTELNDVHTRRDKIKAIRKSRTSRTSSSSASTKTATAEHISHSTKNSCFTKNSVANKKLDLKSTSGKNYVNSENHNRISVASGRNKEKSYSTTEPVKKVSAQSRLIEKRKQFALAAKKTLASMKLDKASNLLMEIEKSETITLQSKVNKYISGSSSSESVATPAMVRVRDRVRRHVKETKEKGDFSNLDDNSNSVSDVGFMEYEEMDWEPSEQEVMIEHIKTMRKNFSNIEELSNDIAVCSNINIEANHNENVILVFDTNVFISCLPFIKEIRDTCIPDFGLPRIFIPWRVLQELDHLKKSDIKPVQVSAIRAIRFLNENFSSRHPRVSGQSFEEFTSASEGSKSCPDDDILQVCLKMKQNDRSWMVILITNDKNLESKAIVSGVEAFSKDKFVKEKLSNSNQSISGLERYSKMKSITLKSDMGYCRLKGALKKFLVQFLEVEFMNAFHNDWKKIVTKKPPWMLMDMFECFIKHWRSVFTLIFKSDILTLVKDLKELFVKVDKGEDVLVEDIAQLSKELLAKMRNFVSHEKPYFKILNETISEVGMWIQSKNTSDIENAVENECTTSLMQVSTSSQEPPICHPQPPEFDVSLCKEKVKNLFQIIWDEVNRFFCRISELAAANGRNNPHAVDEVKNQFPHVIRNVQELIEIVEKILSLSSEDSSQVNQIILHFTNFLVGLNVFQIDATELNNLPLYIGLFCSDNDGRMVLYTFINDLKQFVMGMMDGMKVLEQF